jgi:hypothetical protein
MIVAELTDTRTDSPKYCFLTVKEYLAKVVAGKRLMEN